MENKERKEELESLREQLGLKLDKALAGGSEREINHIRKELKKYESKLEDEQRQDDSCGCNTK